MHPILSGAEANTSFFPSVNLDHLRCHLFMLSFFSFSILFPSPIFSTFNPSMSLRPAGGKPFHYFFFFFFFWPVDYGDHKILVLCHGYAAELNPYLYALKKAQQSLEYIEIFGAGISSNVSWAYIPNLNSL
ncbi:hypothetical protein NE237_014897 [Protea cynaroides]|uniref:Uncharacterized protein n=1 Tax=Protea cynaroides TaxID=273540 RepID=A0A9Q0KD70_9MAGN|nr:hypothetical protein NE237_014897 [Protea cynaroides]